VEAAQMPDYRAYIIGLDGRIQKVVELDDCGDDDAAIERAQQLVDGHDVELWQNERKIALFDRKPENRKF
jgi:hypothetical protein